MRTFLRLIISLNHTNQPSPYVDSLSKGAPKNPTPDESQTPRTKQTFISVPTCMKGKFSTDRIKTKEIKTMKTKFYWLALLASAAMIAQANAGGHGGGGGGGRGGF